MLGSVVAHWHRLLTLVASLGVLQMICIKCIIVLYVNIASYWLDQVYNALMSYKTDYTIYALLSVKYLSHIAAHTPTTGPPDPNDHHHPADKQDGNTNQGHGDHVGPAMLVLRDGSLPARHPGGLNNLKDSLVVARILQFSRKFLHHAIATTFSHIQNRIRSGKTGT